MDAGITASGQTFGVELLLVENLQVLRAEQV
jgi:hypothetical protein